MWNSNTFDLDKMRDEQRRVHEHVGRVVVECAGLDQDLVELLESMGVAAIPRDFEARAKLLGKTLRWPATMPLVERLIEIGRYRNNLGHSAISTLITLATGEVTHGTTRERNSLQFEAMNFADFPLWESRVPALRLVLFTLRVQFESGELHLTPAPLDLLTEFSPEPDPEMRAAFEELFPS